MTLAGLNTINLSQLNTFQQVLLLLLIMLGSAILVSSAVVHVRRKAFERRFKHVIEVERQERRTRRNSELSQPQTLERFRTRTGSELNREDSGVRDKRHYSSPGRECGRFSIADHRVPLFPFQSAQENIQVANPSVQHVGRTQDKEAGALCTLRNKIEDAADPLENSYASSIRFVPHVPPSVSRSHRQPYMSSDGEVSSSITYFRETNNSDLSYQNSQVRPEHETEKPDHGTQKYFNSGGIIGRNSQFYSLTAAERERLGGVEYRAILLLEIIVPIYFVFWQLLGCVGLGAWMALNAADITLQNGLNPWWVGAFNAVSAFNNSGLSLLDANMVAFQTSDYMLITMSLLILAGNTCYPIFLRFLLWSIAKLLPNRGLFMETKSTIRFLLDHPRRCYTTLFPSSHTWWLLGTIVVFNCTDWAAFEILNIGNPSLTSLPSDTRIIDGLFQAIAVRSAGFYVVNVAELRVGLLVLYAIMMYISVYPVVITMRNSNVYEERSLGIYAEDPVERREVPPANLLGSLLRRLTHRNHSSSSEPRGYFIRQQLRGQLAHDLWWIVLAVLFITVAETGQFEADPVNYSAFNILFEVVSAYGCVGISVGLPGAAYSFCGGWHVISKLILCAVMLRGRHRGLPVAIDRAVLLPGEHLGAAEEEDARIRLERTWSKEPPMPAGV
ncbi:hypothetical protein MMC27_003862 [Xylographa pallens]|nr:hypothetical protein [Xylographa pallens]